LSSKLDCSENIESMLKAYGALMEEIFGNPNGSRTNLIIENECIISLSTKDVEIFFDKIDHPPKPNRKLQKAIKKYRESELCASFASLDSLCSPNEQN
jgi:hypothetical protein